MRGFRQVLKLAHAGFGTAAARAEQLPSHHHDSPPGRRQEQLHCVIGGDGP
jgi:hypothetical protein